MERKREVRDYKAYLKKIIELTKKVKKPATSSHYPKSLDTNAKRAFYDNLDQNEELSIELDRVIKSVKEDNFRGNKLKERKIINAMKKVIDEELVDGIFNIVKEQNEY